MYDSFAEMRMVLVKERCGVMRASEQMPGFYRDDKHVTRRVAGAMPHLAIER